MCAHVSARPSNLNRESAEICHCISIRDTASFGPHAGDLACSNFMGPLLCRAKWSTPQLRLRKRQGPQLGLQGRD